MTSDELLNVLKQVGACVAETFGPTCEVVIHDLQTREIVAIENGQVTGRKVGDKLAERVYDYLLSSNHQGERMSGYPSRTTDKGKLLKCSTLVISNDKGEPVATFCLNIEIEQLIKARDIIDSILGTKPLNSQNDNNEEMASVLVHARKIIGEVIQKVGKPLPLASKEGKIDIIRELDAQGVFMVRDVIPSICDVLGISQATLYNYLREVRCESDELVLNTK